MTSAQFANTLTNLNYQFKKLRTSLRALVSLGNGEITIGTPDNPINNIDSTLNNFNLSSPEGTIVRSREFVGSHPRSIQVGSNNIPVSQLAMASDVFFGIGDNNPLVFRNNNGDAVLFFAPNGSIYVKGEFIDTNFNDNLSIFGISPNITVPQ